MRIYKIFMKLMSKHLKFHLALPLGVGIVVEALIAWRQHPSANSVSSLALAGAGSYVAIFLTFLFSAGYLIQKEAKPPWDNILTETLDEVLSDATSVFATCTIPLEEWFHPYTQQYLSYIVKYKVTGKVPRQERVLLFRRDKDLVKAREQYLDGQYAKPLADIHRNYGIPLGFLRRKEIDEILETFQLVGQAAAWKNHKVRNQDGISEQQSDGAISTLDFALVTRDNNRVIVITFDKTGDTIKLVPIEDQPEEQAKGQSRVRPYQILQDKIVKKVFNDSKVNPQHNFAAFSGACGSATRFK